MGLFDNLFNSNSKPNTDIVELVEKSFKIIYEQSIYLIAKEATWMSINGFFGKRQEAKEPIFECVLFNSIIVLTHFQFTLGRRFSEFRNLFYGKLVLFARANSMGGSNQDNLPNYIANKIAFYTGDAEALMDVQSHNYYDRVYSKLVYNFFESPLQSLGKSSASDSMILNISQEVIEMVAKVSRELASMP